MWHPLARWQTFTPESPWGTHRRLQQSLHAWHTVPSNPPWQNDAPAGGEPHVPRVASASMLQIPPQQSAATAHTSPVWMQNEDPSEQVPFAHNLEQQASLPVQALPAVEHDVFRALHAPCEQLALQHCAGSVQGLPSEAHVLTSQTLLTHDRVQQSVGDEHGSPARAHFPTVDVQVRDPGSHCLEQHAALSAQALPCAMQGGSVEPSEPPALASAPPAPG